MDLETINSIEKVLIEAIKILGPAIIAAIATYKVTSSQYKFKIQELSKNQEFKAREHLFAYYKDRQQKLAKSHEELVNSLGQILGAASAVSEDQEIPEIIYGYISILNLYISQAPFEIDTTLHDFKRKNLAESSSDFLKLESYRRVVEKMSFVSNHDLAKDNVIVLLEVYSFLERCNNLLLEKQIKQLFSSYVESV